MDLTGGCGISIDMSLKLAQELEESPAREILIPVMSLPQKLLDNAGYSHEETQVIRKLLKTPLSYDIENEQFVKAT